GYLDDVHVTSEPMSNSLILSAPTKTMELLLALVHELDITAAAKAEINIFKLKKTDASILSQMLQQLFLGTTGTTAGGGGGLPGGGLPGGVGATAAGAVRRLIGTGDVAEGAALIQLSVTVDSRTNSLIVAGSKNDLEVIEAIIGKLESQEESPRHNRVFKMRNQAAADVTTALTTFYTNTLTPFSDAGQLSPFQQLQREVIVVAESISNSVLVSATPKYFEEIARFIEQLDAQPPQVIVECLIAEVDLNTTDEFGMQIGSQSPVLFQRGLTPNGSNILTATSATPGFNFNTTGDL